MNARSPRPTAESIIPRLLDATETLCATHAPADVSMRMIAKEAGLSVGVSYRYFEAREELIGAALERMAERLAEAMREADDPGASVEVLQKALRENPSFPRLVTSAAMSAGTAAVYMSKYPVARDVARSAAQRGIPDPATVAGITMLLGIGGEVYAPTINGALSREADDPRLNQGAREMMALWVASQESGSADE